jgi:hypothetical protein
LTVFPVIAQPFIDWLITIRRGNNRWFLMGLAAKKLMINQVAHAMRDQ